MCDSPNTRIYVQNQQKAGVPGGRLQLGWGSAALPRFFFFCLQSTHSRWYCRMHTSRTFVPKDILLLLLLSPAVDNITPGSLLSPSTKGKDERLGVCVCVSCAHSTSQQQQQTRDLAVMLWNSTSIASNPSMPITSNFPMGLLRHGSWKRGSSYGDQRSSTEIMSSVAPASGSGAQTDRLSSCVREGAVTYTKGFSAAACALCEALVELDHLVHKGGSNKKLCSLVSVYDRVTRGVLLCCEHPAEGAGGGGCAGSLETLTQHVENAKKVAATLCVKRRLARLSKSKQQLERELRNLTDEVHMFATHHTPELATDESGYVSLTKAGCVCMCVPSSCSCFRLARMYTSTAAAAALAGGVCIPIKFLIFHTSRTSSLGSDATARKLFPRRSGCLLLWSRWHEGARARRIYLRRTNAHVWVGAWPCRARCPWHRVSFSPLDCCVR